jgi:hypothetical protein
MAWLMAWSPQPGPQLEAFQATWCDELFFGGARGGGKSDFLLGDFARDVPTYRANWRGVLFRRTYPELEELVARSRMIYPETFRGAVYRERPANEWTFPGGATLKMRHLESDADAESYNGHQYSWIGWDELPLRPTMVAYNKLKACLRSAAKIPDKRIRSTGNPGGAGHQAVKSYFAIDRFPHGFVPIDDEDSGMTRMFIPSKVTDNLILMQNDPGYIGRLKGVGSAALMRAWLDGDWDAVAGAYFDCWDSDRHVIRPFAIPEHWTRFGSFDWGSARPFSMGWWAVSDGALLPDGRQYPAGAMIRYREWYGAGGPNEGLKMTAEAVADGILAREGTEKVSYRVSDPACWKIDGGPSIAERMAKRDVLFRPADNSRVAGWDAMRARMVGDDAPMLYVFDTCIDFIRTIPALQHDMAKPEDLDTDGEDHAADEARYGCLSRPYTRHSTEIKPIRGASEMTMDEAWKLARQGVNERGERARI